jgi:membrane-associated phospholipid phosphatase
VDYFAQCLMLSPLQQNTLRVMEIADQAGLLAAMYFKNKYNRARPQQVSPGLIPMIPPPGHPSWPSGHALESNLIALALMQVMPKNRHAALQAMADRIGKNRERAGVHFESDTAGGKEIAAKIFPYLQKCPTFYAALEAAKAEH